MTSVSRGLAPNKSTSPCWKFSGRPAYLNLSESLENEKARVTGFKISARLFFLNPLTVDKRGTFGFTKPLFKHLPEWSQLHGPRGTPESLSDSTKAASTDNPPG